MAKLLNRKKIIVLKVRINIDINFILDLNRVTYDQADKYIKYNSLSKKLKQCQKNKFLGKNKNIKERNMSNDLNSFKERDKKYTINSYISKINSFNTTTNAHSNTNKEVINFIDGINNTMSGNIHGEENRNKYYNLLYENKISKLLLENDELKHKNQTMKENLILFLTLLKKYSFKLSSLTENISNDSTYLTQNEYKEIKSFLFHLKRTLNNPKLNEDILENSENNIFFEDENNITQNNTNNDTFNDNKIILDEYKYGLEELISKYEQKINILNKENEDILEKINLLNDENNSLREKLNEEKKNNEIIINKFNKIKEENDNLEKKNKLLNYKCASYFNISKKSKFEQKNIEDEIECKNKIIQYLENLLKNVNLNIKDNIHDDMFKRNFNKLIDLKKNLKEVIKDKNAIGKIINKKNFNTLNCMNNPKKKNIENEKSNTTESSMSNKTYKNRQVKKEIEILDKEIGQIQSKLEKMIKNEQS